MTDALAPIGQPDVIHSAPNMTLIARDPHQLQVEQKRLIEWCEAKLTECGSVISELETQIEHHRSHKWNFSALRNALRRENERDLYYTKVLAALNAGFYIVPNFPCTTFAVRTDSPASGYTSSRYGKRSALANLPNQPADVLEVGDGEYRNPRPTGHVSDVTTKQEGTSVVSITHAVVDGYRDIIFPFAFAKPEVLMATQQAMAEKIFDELAVLPNSSVKADPMIIGRIIRPWQRRRWDSEQNLQRHLSFTIVWWLDTATI